MFSTRRFFYLTIAIVVIALGGVISASRIITRQREELRELSSRHDALSLELQQLRRDIAATAAATREATAQEPAAGTAETGPASTDETETKRWLERLNSLRSLLAERPDLGIPELRLLTDREWLRIAKDAQFDTEEHTRQSLAALRSAAKEQFIGKLSSALRKYLAATNGELPPTAIALAPYFVNPVDPAIFPRYEMLHTGNVSKMPDRRHAVIREKTPIDEDYDARYGVDGNAIRRGGGTGDARTWVDDPEGYDGMIRRARAEFSRANNSAKQPGGLEQLAPYINPPLPPAKLDKLLKIERESAR